MIIQKDVLVRHKEIWLRHYFIVKLNNSTKYFLFFYFNDNRVSKHCIHCLKNGSIDWLDTFLIKYNILIDFNYSKSLQLSNPYLANKYYQLLLRLINYDINRYKSFLFSFIKKFFPLQLLYFNSTNEYITIRVLLYLFHTYSLIFQEIRT